MIPPNHQQQKEKMLEEKDTNVSPLVPIKNMTAMHGKMKQRKNLPIKRTWLKYWTFLYTFCANIAEMLRGSTPPTSHIMQT